MKGLLARAGKLRKRLGIDREPAVEAGISDDDLQRIQQEIDRAVAQSRIEVTSEDFKVKAAKQGVLFPAIVNAALVVALALGLGALYVLFQSSQTRIATAAGAAATAEGKLIAELKRQSEAELEAKNREIDAIQGRLADIERQRQELQAGMDARVKAREDELRKAVAAELEAEKQKLQGQGLSEAAIAKRLADLEAAKNAESARLLDTYRRQAEEERARSEASLKALSAEYNANLQRANEDRQKVLADSRRREEELRAQAAASAAALESEKAKAEASLRELAAQKEKEELAASQLVSLYNAARADIAARSYDKAVQSLKAIASYVSQGEVSQLPAIAKRRDVDLFVVDVLSSYVQGEKERASLDTSSLVALASQVTELKNRVAEADRLAREGRTDEAQRHYGEALAVLPDAARAQAYLSALARDAETARVALLRDWLSRAESAFAGKRYNEALDLWKGALAYLPESAERVRATVEGIAAAGAEGVVARARREQSSLAAPLLAKAAAFEAAKAYDDALPLYLEIVGSYPQAGQAAQAVQGIKASVEGLSERAAAERGGQEAALARQLEQARADLAAAAAGNAELTAKLEEANRTIGLREAAAAAAEAKAAEAEKKLADAELRLKEAELRLKDAQAPGASSATVTALTRERDDAVKALADVKAALADRDRTIAEDAARIAAAEAKAAEAQKKLADAQASGASSATVAALTKERDEAVTSLADAKASLAALAQQRDTAVKSLTAANSLLAERDQTIARLQRELDTALKIAGTSATAAVPETAVEAALAAAAPAERVLVEGLQADYKAYQARMAALDAKTLSSNVLEQGKALGYRNALFATASMQKAFPGLGETLRKYDEWWKAEGRAQMVAIVTDLVAKPTRRERKAYLDSLAKKYAGDAGMVALLAKLEPLVGTD